MHSKFSSILRSIFHRFFIDFGRVWGGFWEPCWPPRCIKNWAPILTRFLIKFWSIFIRFWQPETLIFDKQSKRNRCFWNFVIYHILFNFYRLWVPCWLPKPVQNPPKINQKSAYDLNIDLASNFYRFWTDFESQVGPNMGPKWTKNRSKLNVTCICVFKKILRAF